MWFDASDYVTQYSENIILSGTVLVYDITSHKQVDFILTRAKLVFAGEDFLEIIPVKQITKITYYVNDLYIYTGELSLHFYCGSNKDWFREIIKGISNQIV